MGKLGREALQSKATVNFLLNLASVVATTVRDMILCRV